MATAVDNEKQRNLLAGGNTLGRLITEFDWSNTSLGPIERWPAPIRSIVGFILRSPLPIVTLWGEAGVMIYNDAYSEFAGRRHPALLGANVREAWPEVADFNDHVIRTVFREGTPLSFKDQELTLFRAGRPDTAWLNLDYSPIPDDDGQPLGVIAIVLETTDKIIADRELEAERVRLQQIYQQSPSFKALLEGPEHHYAMANEAYRRLIGDRDIIGYPVRDVVPEAVAQGYVEMLDAAYHSGEAIIASGARFALVSAETGEETECFVDFVFQPVSGEDGMVSGIFIDGVDVTARVQAQERIGASESQFRAFAQSMANHVWTSPPNGALDWFNDRTYEYSGLGHNQLQGAGWASIVHEDDLEEASRNWTESLASGANYETEFRIRRNDGQYRWHLVRALPIRSPDGSIIRWIGTNTDIDDQKLAEAQTARDRDRLWTLSQELMLICDFEGIISSVNPSATRMLGFEEAEMVGHRLHEFIHPDDLDRTAAELGRLASGVTTLSFENRHRCKDGDFRLLDWTAVPEADRIHAVGRDITEERRLARDRERIWTLSPVVKVIADNQGIIRAVNPSWTKIMGWTAEQTIGRRILEFVDPDGLPSATARLARLAAPDATVSESRSIFRDRDGEAHHFAWTTVPEGGMLYLFGRDITAEVTAADTLEITEEALRQSQKMEAVGQLTGGIAHDFNNLLQGITGSLEIIQRRIARGKVDDLDRFIIGASGAANRAAALTHRLLAFSRRQPLDPRTVRVNPLLESMQDLLRRSIGERIDLDYDLEHELWLTLCDPNQLENAILNLVINARDAMPDGGRISIETCNVVLDHVDAAAEYAVSPGEYICVFVADTGVGMDSATIARAFEPFFTTKPIGQGTGLGLSMIYGFARQSEGFVKIVSDAGRGTTIRLFLPRYAGPSDEREARPQHEVAEARDRSETVLVIEDDPVVRDLIVEVLGELGYHVLTAVDGSTGVEQLRSPNRIDLLVTDIGLPGLNGRQVADAGRAIRPELKILFMTGYAENAALASGFLEPGMAMITKPFTIDAFAARIREILEG